MKEKFCFMKHGTGLLISLLCAVTGVFAAPVVFDVAIGNAISKPVVLILGIGFLVAVILLLIALLVRKEQYETCTFKQAVLKTVCFSGVSLLCWLVLALLFGLIATLIYFVLKNVLGFEQIKGIVNLITVVVTLMVLPFGVSVFWTIVKTSSTGAEGYKRGLKVSKKTYQKLLIAVALLYGLGVLITTMFQFLPYSILLRILKTIILTVVGGTGFWISDKICQYEGGSIR